MKIPKVVKVNATVEKTVMDIFLDFETRATTNSSGRGVAAMNPAKAGMMYAWMKRGTCPSILLISQ